MDDLGHFSPGKSIALDLLCFVYLLCNWRCHVDEGRSGFVGFHGLFCGFMAYKKGVEP